MNGFDRVALRAREMNTLFSCLLELTYRCDLDCFYCYNDLKKRGRPVPTERYLDLLQELRDLDVLNLVLSGGEPLAHPGFWQIARRASDLAFAVRVKSNGHSVDADVARRLHDEVGPFMIDVSLHGATPATHDRQTRVAGSFDKLMKNLPAMLGAGLHVKLNATLTAWNASEIEEMHRIADDLGVVLALNFVVSPKDDGDRTPLEIAPSVDQMTEAARFLRTRATRSEIPAGGDPVDETPRSEGAGTTAKNCGVGSSTLAIDPYGDVFPCVQWRRPVGNILERTLAEIWFGNARLEEIRSWSIEAGRMVASLGPTGRLMAFCPALAEQETGSPLGIYQSASDRAEAFTRPVELTELDGEAPRPDVDIAVRSLGSAPPGSLPGKEVGVP